MRVEIVNDTEGATDATIFPPGENFVDLRQNPRAVERIAAARTYLPLRNFLSAINSPPSVFASATAAIEGKPEVDQSTGEIHEFSSWVRLVFAVLSLNFDEDRYTELTAALTELLARDPEEAIRAELRVAPCHFPDQHQRGFCLCIRLLALGDSAKQAELRWGFGLARVQQALLFRARAMGQQIGV